MKTFKEYFLTEGVSDQSDEFINFLSETLEGNQKVEDDVRSHKQVIIDGSGYPYVYTLSFSYFFGRDIQTVVAVDDSKGEKVAGVVVNVKERIPENGSKIKELEDKINNVRADVMEKYGERIKAGMKRDVGDITDRDVLAGIGLFVNFAFRDENGDIDNSDEYREVKKKISDTYKWSNEVSRLYDESRSYIPIEGRKEFDSPDVAEIYKHIIGVLDRHGDNFDTDPTPAPTPKKSLVAT